MMQQGRPAGPGGGGSKQWVELQLLCRGNMGKSRILQSLLAYYQKVSPHLQQQALPTVPDLTLNIPRSIDLVQLYEEVVDKGGYDAVSKNARWPSVALSMKLKIAPTKLQALYATWLRGFEAHQIGPKRHRDTSDETTEPIATHAEIQLTTSVRQTPLPVVTKRLKTHRNQLSDLGVMHRFVLALDSNLPDHVEWALNQLIVLSFGSPKDPDCDLLLAHVPGLLDALLRQIHLSSTHADPSLLSSSMNPDDVNDVSVFEHPVMQADRTCRVLHILRNLAMIPDNQTVLASHSAVLDLLPVALKQSQPDMPAREAVDLLWDIAVQLASHNTPSPSIPNSTTVSDALIDVVVGTLLDSSEHRATVLRAAQVLAQWLKRRSTACADRILRHASFRLLLARIVEGCSRNRQDGWLQDDDDDDDVAAGQCQYDNDDDDENIHSNGDDDPYGDLDEALPTWSGPWEEGQASYTSEVGANMGMVFASKGWDGEPESKNIDVEVRDCMLHLLYLLTDRHDVVRVAVATLPAAMRRLVVVMTSCIGRAESARLAVGVLSNLALAPATLPYFLPVEKELVLVAMSDPSLADMLANILVDVYGMNSL
ncbi:hypothetical protein H310_13775, partial [Aphanomyces invadans]